MSFQLKPPPKDLQIPETWVKLGGIYSIICVHFYWEYSGEHHLVETHNTILYGY